MAFLTTEYPPMPSGGIGTGVRTLARALVAKGHKVTVVGWGREAQFEDEGVRVRFLPETRIPRAGWLLNRRAVASFLNGLVRDEALDVVEAHDWVGPSAGLNLDCPLVVRCHGSATYFAYLLGEKVRPSVRLAEQSALRGAHDIAAVSRFTAHLTGRLFRLKKEIGVIPNGVDTSRFRPAGRDETEANTILYFGTLVRKKGVLDLCSAFSLLAEQHPDVRLRLIGRDAADLRTGSPSTWALCRRELTPSAADRVEYLGSVPYDEIQCHVRKAALCVFPSHAEALPFSWLEAMACGKAVIAYDTGWAREIIQPDVDGVLVGRGEVEMLSRAIGSLLVAPERALELGVRARQRVESTFSTSRMVESSVRWYEQVVTRG
ncbi:MAG: glycosyltransferase family 4 protein [Chloroflexia bacterium]